MIDTSVPQQEVRYFRSVSELCKALGVPLPRHPLIALFDHNEVSPDSGIRYVVHDCYMISYKTNMKGKLKYGQGYYDFDEGGLIFVAPHQALSVADEEECKGYSLFFHPDLLSGHPLAAGISKYGFFGYNINEALHLSEEEKHKLLNVFGLVREELATAIDDSSSALLAGYLQVLLDYSNRYYKRQFLTRQAISSPLLEQFETLLDRYYSDGSALHNGTPTVKYFARKLHISPGYLSDLLRSLTSLNAQQHIHAKVIAIAKQKLSTTDMTAAEIAYELGFEYPQSFNKLFKNKTQMTPLAYKQSLN